MRYVLWLRMVEATGPLLSHTLYWLREGGRITAHIRGRRESALSRLHRAVMWLLAHLVEYSLLSSESHLYLNFNLGLVNQ